MLSQPRFLHRSDNSFSSNCGTDEEFSCALFDRASEYSSCESKTADRRRAAQLLQEIDKAALVCPRRSGGARAIHARRAARRSHFHSLFGATGAPRSPSLCLAALQSMRTSLGGPSTRTRGCWRHAGGDPSSPLLNRIARITNG